MPDKQQYVSEVEEKMSDWDRRIEEILQKAEESDKDSVLVKDLLEKQQEAKTRFEELQTAGEGQYDDLKGRVSVATQALQDVLVRTSEQFQLGNPRPASGSTRAGDEAHEASRGGSGFGGGSGKDSVGRGERGSAGPSGGGQSQAMQGSQPRENVSGQQDRQGPRTQPGQGQPGGFGGGNQERRGEGGAGGVTPGAQRPTNFNDNRETNTAKATGQSAGDSAEKADASDDRGSMAGKEPVGEARPGEAQKRRSA